MKALVTHVRPPAVALLLLLCAAPSVAAQRRAPRDRGGTSLLLEVKADAPQAGVAVERTAAVIGKRCARLGVYCQVQTRPGGAANRLALRFSTTLDTGRVKSVLLAEGMELRAVVSVPYPFPIMEYATRDDPVIAAVADKDVFPVEGYGQPETYVITVPGTIITGDDLRDPCYVTRAPRDFPGEGYAVDCRLRPAGAARLKAWTRAHLGHYVAVIYNGRALDVPYIRATIWYNVVVSGGFSRREAEDVAVVLTSGNLPAPVEVLEEGTYKP